MKETKYWHSKNPAILLSQQMVSEILYPGEISKYRCIYYESLALSNVTDSMTLAYRALSPCIRNLLSIAQWTNMNNRGVGNGSGSRERRKDFRVKRREEGVTEGNEETGRKESGREVIRRGYMGRK